MFSGMRFNISQRTHLKHDCLQTMLFPTCSESKNTGLFVTQGLSQERQHNKFLHESRARKSPPSPSDTSLPILKLRMQTTWHPSLSFQENNLLSGLLLIHRQGEAILMKIIWAFCEFYNFHLLVLLYTEIRMCMDFPTPYHAAWHQK